MMPGEGPSNDEKVAFLDDLPVARKPAGCRVFLQGRMVSGVAVPAGTSTT